MKSILTVALIFNVINLVIAVFDNNYSAMMGWASAVCFNVVALPL